MTVAALADETCMSPCVAKTVGLEGFVCVCGSLRQRRGAAAAFPGDQPVRQRLTAAAPSAWMARYLLQKAASIFLRFAGVPGFR